MIIPSIKKFADNNPEIITPYGTVKKRVSVICVTDYDGDMIHCVRNEKEKVLVNGPEYLSTRTSGIAPNPFVDRGIYTFGIPAKKGLTDPIKIQKKIDRAKECQKAMIDLHEGWLTAHASNCPPSSLLVMKAYVEFLKKDHTNNELFTKADIVGENWVLVVVAKNMDEYLSGNFKVPHEDDFWGKIWVNYINEKSGQKEGVSALSGKRGHIADLHKAVCGAQLVSFNDHYQTHYNLSGGDHYPILLEEAHQYVSAFEYLIRSKKHCYYLKGGRGVSDQCFISFPITSSTSNWYELLLNGEADKTKLDTDIWYKTLKGLMVDDQTLNEEWVFLHLKKNNTRWSCLMYERGSALSFIDNLMRHFDRCSIEGCDKAWQSSIWKTLKFFYYNGKNCVIPEQVMSNWINAVFSGGNYPVSLFSLAIQKIDSEMLGSEFSLYKFKKCISLIKAILIKNYKQEGLTMSLDENRKDVGYKLGRLYAIHERVYNLAHRKTNSNYNRKNWRQAINRPEMFIANSSGNFRMDLCTLMERGCEKTDNNGNKIISFELGKALSIHFDKLSIKITKELDGNFGEMKKSAIQKALFVIGYDHQREDFFKKKENKKEE